MCGFAGALQGNIQNEAWETILRQMGDTLVHRGPDDSGIWFDAEENIGLSFRRLAILDLSQEGHQPMHSPSGRYVIVFNGEVYNHQEIKKELLQKHYQFRGHSDTEAILAAIEEWGLENAVKRFIGMFAFALWDRKERKLSLVRDRLGIKPLYYGLIGKTFLFGSELKALRIHPEFKSEIDRGAVALLMRHNYIPAPYSIYKGISKLLPGTILSIQSPAANYQAPEPYWSAKTVAEEGVANSFTGSEIEAAEQLDSLLSDAVGLRMVADVPLGAFLSGGIDSSTVVALMQAQSNRPVKTFTIGFHEQGYNEAVYAKAVAEHLGTDHTELYIKPEQAMEVIPKLPTLYDEPFSDSSQIPTFLVSELTRRHVTVSLSGDGGDELFCGYNRYKIARDFWRKVGWLPTIARRGIAGLLHSIPVKALDWSFGWMDLMLSRYSQPGRAGHKLHKIAEIMTGNQEVLYHRMISHWNPPQDIIPDAVEPVTVFSDPSQRANLSDFNQQMMFLDMVTYLPDDILAKVDRASMGVSLEVRIPVLDHRVVEFAWRVPLSMKIRHGQGKWLLRQVLYKYVPQELIERPKMGFGVPIGQWIRGPLRDWAESLLDTSRLRQDGIFNPAPIEQKWKEHLSEQRNWTYYLWDVLMFQAWLSNNK